METELRFRRITVVRSFGVIVAALVTAHILFFVIRIATGHDYVLGVAPLFDLDHENNIPTWYQSIALLICATLLAWVAYLHRVQRAGDSHSWAFLAAVMLLLSVDEMASIHEKIDYLVDASVHPSFPFRPAWVLPGLLFTAIVGLFLLRWLMRLPERTRNRFLLAGAVFLLGAVGMESLEAWSARGILSFPGPSSSGQIWEFLLLTAEEGLEMIGVVLFLDALLRHIEYEGPKMVVALVGANQETPQARL